MTPEAIAVLRLRQTAARASVAKYDALLARADEDDVLRHTFQFAGASRTNRWAGRGFQPQNLARTPKLLEPDGYLACATDAIRDDDLDTLDLMFGEPMDVLAGCVRSSLRAPDGYEWRVADLASIESRVIGWVSKCERLNRVFAEDRDAYKDFATEFYGVPYDAVTKTQRTNSKPATLGAGFGLGGGDLVDGKRTGLWGYAEKMGIELTREEARLSVTKFREAYPEIPELWYAIDAAAARCVRTGATVEVNEFLRFERREPYLMLRLPSGRYIFYAQPALGTFWFAKHPVRGTIKPLGQDEKRAKRAEEKGWKTYSRVNLIYSGKPQNKPGWVRLPTRGAKVVENLVQSIARDVLKEGMLAAAADGFDLRMTAHDEIVCLQRVTDKVHTWQRLAGIMSRPLPWAPGLLLGAAGWAAPFYKKD